MSRVITVLVLVFLTGRARSEPAVVRLAPTEGPFDNAFADKCRSMGAVECKRIMSARTAPFERVELHEAGGGAYVADRCPGGAGQAAAVHWRGPRAERRMRAV